MQISDEQQLIINHICDGYNVVVDAIAGSGKSTTILFLARHLPNSKILQITYNSMLRHEIKEKIKTEEIDNVEVHTFHSLAVKYYNRSAFNDIELKKTIYNNPPPQMDIDNFDIIVLDEAQDMSLIYYKIVCKFLIDLFKQNPRHKIQLLVLGDFMQGLYEFKGSDIRYLTMAEQIWTNFLENSPNIAFKCPEFKHCTLKMSYRITNQMCAFINNILLGNNRINSCKDDVPIFYIRKTTYEGNFLIYHHILNILQRGYKPDDIFILSSSIKNSIRKIELIR